MLCQASGCGSSFLPGLGPYSALWGRHVGSRHMSVPGELGSTGTILPQYCMLQGSSAFWLFCSPCHELSMEEKGKKGLHRVFPLP